LKIKKQKGMGKIKTKRETEKNYENRKIVLLQNGLLGQEYVLGRRNGRKHRKFKKE
jgi:hypothetical protein